MHAQPAAATFNYAPIGTVAATAIGVAIAILVWAAVSNNAFPDIGSHDRAALRIVFGLGVGWTAPLTSAGQLFGGSFATLSVERIAIAGLGLLILVKWVLGFSHYVIRR